MDIPSEREHAAASASRNLIRNPLVFAHKEAKKRSDDEEEDYEKGKNPRDPNSQEPELLYVERRYCTACNFEQPIRAKHCKDCNRCVAQYDHHCPWIGTNVDSNNLFKGNCVGEKNHHVFFWFLLFQSIEVVWALLKVKWYLI